MIRKVLVGLAAVLVSSASFAQGSAPKVGNRPLIQVKPKPKPFEGCKLVGTVRGTRLWAGDCVSAPELKTNSLHPEDPAKGSDPANADSGTPEGKQ